MRAGCFAENRIINLLNRRFVSFYYNTGGPGLGKDAAAAAFVKGKTHNVWAFYAAFDHGGEALGIADVSAAGKDHNWDYLMALLRQNPEYDQFTKAEQAVLDRAAAGPKNAEAQLEAGQLLEDIGRYKDAEPHYRRVLDNEKDGAAVAEAFRGLLRMARYQRQWERLEELARAAEKRGTAGLAADLAMERGYRLNAEKRWDELRKAMAAALGEHKETKRLAEFHFYAGVASFFLKDKDRAYYHWCWVVENLPEDRLARRCFIAAAHEGMPYANPELGNYSAPLRGGNIGVINNAYQAARRVYLRLAERAKE
jgi:tetratricopeptide (TPR) repeat protein